MIISRHTELRRLDELLTALACGHGAALVVHGDAGIGKTTLLEALAERAGDTVTVVRACGTETEAELPFAALADLLGPVLGHLDALPGAQAAALKSALALEPPRPGDRLAVCVAALGVLRAAARHRPVLAIVDDVQWADASSRECIEYVAHRADGPLAVVLAARDPLYPTERVRLAELAVGPVDEGAAAELLRRRAPGLAPPVAAAITRAAAGNPLALVELPASLTDGQRRGAAALELPLAPAGRLQHAFAGRVEALDEQAQRALLIAAAYDGDTLAVIAAACPHGGTSAGRLTDAEELGLVRLGPGRVSFAHPLIRGLVYARASAARRRAAHAALAAVVPDDDRRAWHQAAAAVGPDENVALALERVGSRAAARRAYAAGADALERAARLTPSADAAGRRLITAGQAAAGAGLADRALELFAEAAQATTDASQAARAQMLRGRMLAWRGRAAEATPLLIGQARQIAARWPAQAAAMLAEAANGSTISGCYLDAERLAREAARLLGDEEDPAVRGPVLAALGWALTLRGRAPEARPVLAEASCLAAGLDRLGPDWSWLHVILRSQIPLGEFEQARADSQELCRRARDAGALGTLSGALQVAADTAFRLGDWDAADAATLEAIQVAGDVGQPAVAGWALTIRARILAARGRPADSRAAAETALDLAQAGIGAGLRFVHGALGFLELGLDRPEAAVSEFEAIEQLIEGTGAGEPTIVPWAQDLVEAYARLGRDAEARRALARLEDQAASTASPVAAAAAARCRGLIEEDFEPAFTRALALDGQRPMPFERARTLLAFGRRLHRAGRRAEAREQLRAAMEGFGQLGADAWTGHAERELRAAGGRRRQKRDARSLTPQEQRVAEAVRRGASNRAIAADMFLSPKTIEFHLRQIYRKLDIHSRTQLVAALTDGPGPVKSQ